MISKRLEILNRHKRPVVEKVAGHWSRADVERPQFLLTPSDDLRTSGPSKSSVR